MASKDDDAEVLALKYVFKVAERAPDEIKTLGDQLFYLAERGDVEATAILDAMVTPERLAKHELLEEALDWDQWTREGDAFGFSEKSRFHDPDELLEGYVRYLHIEKLVQEELDKRIAAGELESFKGEDGETHYQAVEGSGATPAGDDDE